MKNLKKRLDRIGREEMNKQLDKLKYVDQAESVINQLSKNKREELCLTTNKIRNLLSLITELYNMVDKREAKLDENTQSHVQYVRMKIVYEAGRDKYVKEFCEKSGILEYLKGVNDSTEALLLVCRYMEALVAYHRFITNEK